MTPEKGANEPNRCEPPPRGLKMAPFVLFAQEADTARPPLQWVSAYLATKMLVGYGDTHCTTQIEKRLVVSCCMRGDNGGHAVCVESYIRMSKGSQGFV
jgi:hypothetical protein